MIDVSQIDVIIGTTAVKGSSFALSHFLKNQSEIQSNYGGSELIIATDQPDFVDELQSYLIEYKLRGCVILYRTDKPDNATNHRIWSMTFGREAIREYFLTTDAEYLLSVDADMTFDPRIIDIMKREISDNRVIQSGYMMRSEMVNAMGFGLGCTFMRRDVLTKIKFRCLEFDKGDVIEEGVMFEFDLARQRIKTKKGIFLSINHYSATDEIYPIEAGKINLFQRCTNLPLIRYALIRLSIMLKFDATRYLQCIIYSRR